jgi:VWFA-related protein
MRRAMLLFLAIACAFPQRKPDLELQLVRLDVTATDAKGNPVTDLSAGDLQVRENGRARTPVFFHYEGAAAATPPSQPNEFANPPAPTPILILLDRWNDRLITTAGAWIDLGAALERMPSVERVFIYLLTNRGDLLPVHPLPPADADLRSIPEPTPAELRAELDQAVRKSNGFRSIDIEDPVQSLNITFRALSSLSAQMALIAGRKNLIWVTRGLPAIVVPSVVDQQGADMISRMEAQSVITAAEGRIAIYPVDESGANPNSLTRVSLQTFASLTGGRWYSGNTSAPALSGAVADGRGSYRLAYYSPVSKNDQKEHNIRLQSRRKGVRLLTLEGYAGDQLSPDPGKAEQGLFADECHSPFEATEVGLRVTPSRGPAGKWRFAIRVDPADLLLEQHGGTYQGQLALLFAFYSKGVLEETPPPIPVDIDLTPDQFKEAQKQGIDISQAVQVNTGLDKIRVVAMDRQLLALGSVTIPVQ